MEGQGVYVPAFRRKEKTIDVERESWDELRRRINALVNKVSANNLRHVLLELFEEDLIRGRGLLCRSCMKSQIASPAFSDVIASVVNSKLPSIGALLVRRLVSQIRRAHERNDKPLLLAVVKFLAHLVNNRVVGETIALEVIHMLLGEPTENTVEVAVVFVRECGVLLLEVSPRLFNVVFDVFRRIVQEGDLEFRSRCLIESLFALRRSSFEGRPAVRGELDLVDSDEKVTHEISLYDESDPETSLDVYKPDPEFHRNERKYEQLKRKILGEQDTEEKDDDDVLCSAFESMFVQQYATVHRLETNKLSKVAMFFAHVLATDALPWRVLGSVWLTEEDTTSSSRIFLKILFQELCEQMGLRALNEKLQDPTMEDTFESIFPKDHLKNMRFSINFFTSIGLGGITEKLRQLLAQRQNQ